MRETTNSPKSVSSARSEKESSKTMNKEIHETEPETFAEWHIMCGGEKLGLFEQGQAWILTDTVVEVEQ